MKRSDFWPMFAVMSLWGAAFTVSCNLTACPPGPHQAGSDRGSALGALFGESRVALGGVFYQNADKYFHRGVEHARAQAFDGALFQRLRDDISPRGHAHATGQQVTEIMPWLQFAIASDPHRIETYLVAAFWLATDADRPDVALEVLDRAQWNNPFSYEVQLEKGRILLHQHRADDARQAFDAGLAFWPGTHDPRDEGVRHDRASLLLYRALLYEAAGKKTQAIAALREILALFPARTHLLRRIATLEKGDRPALLAQEYWQRALADDTRQRRQAPCGRDDTAACDHEDCEHEGHAH